MRITVSVAGHQFSGTLNASATAAALAARLPLTVTMSRWGDEFYGDCGLDGAPGDPQEQEVAVGDLVVWPPGRALCLLFGPTPASTGDAPVLASPGVRVGSLAGDLTKLRALGQSVTVVMEAAL